MYIISKEEQTAVMDFYFVYNIITVKNCHRPKEDRSEDDNVGGVKELREGSGHFPTTHQAVYVSFRKQCEGGTGLLEASPEHDVEHKDDDHNDHAVPVDWTFLDPAHDQVGDHIDTHDGQQA